MSDSTASKKLLPRLGCFGWAFVALALSLLAVAAALMIWSRGVERDVRARLEQLRAAGEPLTPDDLADVYRLPPSLPDSSRFWLSAIEPLDGEAFVAACAKGRLDEVLDGKIPPPGEPWPQLADARELLAQYAPTLRALHDAAADPGGVRYPMRFGDGIAMLVPHAQRLRGAARLLALEAQVKAHDGDAAGATAAIRTGFTAARTLEHDPILVVLFVRIACDGVARSQIEQLLSKVEFSDADLARLRADLQQARYQDGLLRAMQGERVIGLATIRNPAQALAEPDTSLGGDAPFGGLRLFRGNDTRSYLECMELVVDQAKLPPPQALAGMKRIDADVAAMMGGGSMTARIRNPLTSLLVPALSAVFSATARGTASKDTADAALAVEQFRRLHGRLPERLDDLVPDFMPSVPTDAFDGKPLRYIVRPDRYVVYSVGQDLIDQGGVKGATPNDSGDLTFEVEAGNRR
ncbi:MAG TPA: hypothetical protein VGX78_11495 [Pirellulales bacterium]|nr:hypothetical protein [Pirellulales bacterium]